MGIAVSRRLDARAGDPIMAHARGLKTAVMKALQLAAKRVIPVLISRTFDAPKASDNGREGAVASEALIKSWTVDVNPAGLSIVIRNVQKYAPAVNNGVRTGHAKIATNDPAVIQRFVSWMFNRGIMVTSKNGRRIMSPERGARIIIGAINARQGYWRFRPRTITTRAFPRVQEIFVKLIVEARQKHLEATVGKK